MAGRRPDYKVTLASKSVNDAGKRRYSHVGAGWNMDNAGISIQLDPGIVINWRDCDDFYLTLFPYEEGDRGQPPPHEDGDF